MSDGTDPTACGPVISRSENGGPISGLADKLTSGGFSPGEFAMPYEVDSLNGCCVYRGDDLELAYEMDDRALVLPPPGTAPCPAAGLRDARPWNGSSLSSVNRRVRAATARHARTARTPAGTGSWGLPVCRRHGHQWQVQLGLRIAVVADSVGMKHL
jgi:hypothetical protein